jgi:hypothetical protein
MIDEIFDRHYQAGRAQLNAALLNVFRRVGKTTGDSLKVLHRIEWSAPWAPKQTGAKCN